MAADGSVVIKILGESQGFEKTLKSLKSSIANVGAAAAKVTAGAAVAVGTAAAVIVKKSVEAYSEYEQLIGGVDTLFKESSATVQQYAANAYKTAGMSANEYMNTVTAFSASLLQSLDGDTAAAAEKANVAITDMSDNANKMGTDMERITDAYQGFAKQNYTMLDNLKLGYGGTKEEMQRLLDDAEKLSGIEYDISSYSDIVDAIHVVQTEMGITGTTAKEASSTIQGSLSSMQSAWENMLVGMADPSADFDGLVNNLVETASTFGKNVIPVIEQSIEGIIKLADTLLPTIIDTISAKLPELVSVAAELLLTLVDAIVNALPQLAEAAVEIITTLADGISEALPELVPAITEAVVKVVEVLTDPGNTATFLEAGVSLITALGEGLVNSIPILLEAAPQIILNLATYLGNCITSTIPAMGVSIITTLISGIMSVVSQLASWGLKAIVWVCNGIAQGAASLITAGIGAISKFASGIAKGISAVISAVANVIKQIVSKFASGASQMITAGKNILAGLAKGITAGISSAVNAAAAAATKVKNKILSLFKIASPSKWAAQVGIYICQGLANGLKKNDVAVKAAAETAEKTKDIILDKAEEINKELEELQKREDARKAEEELETYKENIAKKNEEIAEAETKDKAALQKELARMEEEWQDEQKKSALEAEQELLDGYKDLVEDWSDEYEKALDKVQDKEDKLYESMMGYRDLYEEDDGKISLNRFEKNISDLKKYENVLNGLKERGFTETLMDEVLKLDIDDAITYGNKILKMEDEAFKSYVEAWETQEEVAKAIAEKYYQDELNTLENEFSQKLNKVLAEIPEDMKYVGKSTIEGWIEGLKEESGSLYSAVTGIAKNMIEALKNELEIHSPSKKTEKLIGLQSAAGIEKGFVERMKAATVRMRAAISADNLALQSKAASNSQAEKMAYMSSGETKVINNTSTVEKTPVIEFSGNLGALARVLVPHIRTEERRIGATAIQGV